MSVLDKYEQWQHYCCWTGLAKNMSLFFVLPHSSHQGCRLTRAREQVFWSPRPPAVGQRLSSSGYEE